MKTILYLLGIVILLIGGFFAFNAFIYNEKQEDTTNTTVGESVVLEGVVSDVNLDGVAADGPAVILFETAVGEIHRIEIPSMSLPLCAAVNSIDSPYEVAAGDPIMVRGTVSETGAIVPCADEEDYVRVGMGTYTSTEYGFQFTYEKGHDGYTREQLGNLSGHPDFVLGLVLTDTDDYIDQQEATEPREGAPTISLRVYQNRNNQSAAVWTEASADETNLNYALTDLEETLVGDARAIYFIADGLYRIRTYVVAHGGYVYVMKGEFFEEDDVYHEGFSAFVASLTFTPSEDEPYEST